MYTLITGASSGIGFAMAEICAEKKQDLILTARRESELQSLAKQLREKYKIQCHVLPADLSASNAATKLIEQIRSNNWEVSILINNAGFGSLGPYVKSDLKRNSEMIQLNITALTEITHLLLPQMLKKGKGSILNVASTAAFQAGPLMAVYYATKAFVLSYSEALHEELLGSGISVTALCPGPTASEFQQVANAKQVPLFNLLTLPTSKAVAEFGISAMENHKAIAVHGTINKWLVFLNRLTPRFVLRKIVKRLQENK